MEIRKIDNQAYYEFLKANVGKNEQIDLNKRKAVLTAFGVFNNGKIVSVGSWFRHNGVVRVKGLYTLREERGKGLGTAMLTYILEETNEKYYDAFATHCSEGIFKKAGFVKIKEREYPRGKVAYMVKKA